MMLWASVWSRWSCCVMMLWASVWSRWSCCVMMLWASVCSRWSCSVMMLWASEWSRWSCCVMMFWASVWSRWNCCVMMLWASVWSVVDSWKTVTTLLWILVISGYRLRCHRQTGCWLLWRRSTALRHMSDHVTGLHRALFSEVFI